ncbi:MAG: ECF-type sigma factor [bacterium]|nr:ECF-type sigma factor [bacterium]
MSTQEPGAGLEPRLYSELRRIAANYLGRERDDHTLQPTALVHEAWMRLAHQSDAEIAGEAHFRALASQAMRRILVDHARGKNAQKRGSGAEKLTLGAAEREGAVENGGPAANQAPEVLALDGALERLAAVSQRQARVVEMKFFGGMTIEEIAAALEVSKRTIDGDWRVARAWLQREIGSGGD